MLKVGLTGGIAAGKTTVLGMFESLGAFTVRADEVAHDLMRPGHEVFDQVVRTFGSSILDPDGEISRPRLADIAFGNHRIAELNAIVHPAVVRFQEDWLERIRHQQPHAVAIVEAALMIEAGAHKHMDKLIVVTCSEPARLERFMQRTGLDASAASLDLERRMQAQIPESEKARIADYVIDNSGSFDDAKDDVFRVWKSLLTDESLNANSETNSL